MSSQASQSNSDLHQTETILPSADVAQLKDYHQRHFPGQPIPSISPSDKQQEEGEDDDGLGYYADGVKRTLTDDQIKMFRHSEIQRLLSKRRQARSHQEDEDKRERQRQRKMHRAPHFDDPGKQNNRVDTLSYDDEPSAETAQDVAQGRKFLWPKLGG